MICLLNIQNPLRNRRKEMHVGDLQKIPPLVVVDVGVDDIKVVRIGCTLEVFVQFLEDRVLRHFRELNNRVRIRIVTSSKLERNPIIISVKILGKFVELVFYFGLNSLVFLVESLFKRRVVAILALTERVITKLGMEKH